MSQEINKIKKKRRNKRQKLFKTLILKRKYSMFEINKRAAQFKGKALVAEKSKSLCQQDGIGLLHKETR